MVRSIHRSPPVQISEYTEPAATEKRLGVIANNSGTLYPGAIIGAETLSDGTLTPKVFDRAPLTFSASLEGVLDGDVSATLDKPSLSAFREAADSGD